MECTSSPSRSRTRAFTMIEVLIVVGMMVLFAGIAIFRLSGQGRREAMYAADEVSDMLTMFAHRESIGFDNVAVGFDPASQSIMLLELRGDPSIPGDPVRWDFDRFVKPVMLPEAFEVTGVRVDGLALNARDEWFIPITPGEGRPTIEINLASRDSDVRCLVYLPAFAHTAQVLYEGDQENMARVPADLDALGKDREVW